jgi:hypothetical protein
MLQASAMLQSFVLVNEISFKNLYTYSMNVQAFGAGYYWQVTLRSLLGHSYNHFPLGSSFLSAGKK